MVSSEASYWKNNWALIVLPLMAFTLVISIPIQNTSWQLFYVTFRLPYAGVSILACIMWFRVYLLWPSDSLTVAACCCACLLLDVVLSYFLHKLELSDRSFMWSFVTYFMLGPIIFWALWRVVKKVDKSLHAKSYTLVGFIWWVAGLHVIFASYFFTQGFFHFFTHTSTVDGLKLMYSAVFIVVMAVFRMVGTYSTDKATRSSQNGDWVKACFGIANGFNSLFYFNFYFILFTDPGASTFLTISMQVRRGLS